MFNDEEKPEKPEKEPEPQYDINKESKPLIEPDYDANKYSEKRDQED